MLARAATLAVLCAVLVVPTPMAGASVQVRAQAPRTYALGAYAGAGNPAGVTRFGAQVGTRMQYAMEFLDGTSWATITQPTWQLSHWAGSGYSMIWGIPMLPDSGASLARGATGAYDTYFSSLARTLVAAGQGSSIIRIGWEFNGIWFPWAAKGHAKDFIGYWRQIVTTMRAVPGAQFKFVWNPDRGDFGAGDLAQYYPGNAYVDYVGLDVYDEEWQDYPGAKAEVTQVEDGPFGLNWLAKFAAARHKAMFIPEWGLGWGTCRSGAPVTAARGVCGGDNPVFIKGTSKWFARHDVVEVNYWDYGSSLLTATKNRLTRAALRRYWVDPPSHATGSAAGRSLLKAPGRRAPRPQKAQGPARPPARPRSG